MKGIIEDSKLIKRTERLILRPVEISDYSLWRESSLERLPKQNEFDKGPPAEKTLTKQFLKKWISGNKKARQKDLLYTFGIFDKKSKKYMGLVNFCVISRLSYQFANMGYELHNQYWGQGYGTEAVHGGIELAFKKLKIHRVEAGIESHNKASIRLCEKLKMRKEGIREKYFFNGKEWIDLVYFSMTAEDIGLKRTKPTITTSLNDLI
ncbi:MAG: GNAT family N-acetyltransferase [Halobacteriovoraceae bacterium]|nr:GNAT family N-acetyltransferase [Halobacteriovoraceae bacterium]